MTDPGRIAGELSALLGPDCVLISPGQIEPFRRDATALLRGDPGLLVLPRTTQEVAAVIRAAVKGLSKKACLGTQFSPPSMELLRRIKRAFDPDNILNPGKILE